MPEFDYYKIGFSNNPEKRFKNIETSIPFNLKMVFWMRDEEASRIESHLRYKFSSYRIKGEWFNFNLEKSIEVISLALCKHYNLIFKGGYDRNSVWIDEDWYVGQIKKYNETCKHNKWQDLYEKEVNFLIGDFNDNSETN